MKQLNGVLTSTKALFATFAVFAAMVVLPLVTFGQITSATIVGTITDPNGSPVPNATVTARNTDTGLTRTVPTNEEGSYRFEFLPIGNYVVEVTAAAGFKKAFQGGVVLNVNDTKRIDVALQVGTVSEEVTVSTAPPEINT